MKNLPSKILILSAFLALFVSCSSSDSPAPTPVDTKPTISSFSPQSTGLGSTLTITGTNFSTTAANNKVTINGVEATVTAATATQLSVTVPACTGTGDVKVTVGSTTVTAASQFTFEPLPTISSFSPLNGGFGSTIIIFGTNFSTTPTDNSVTINGVAATVIAATATQLTVTVPDCKGTGDVKVTVANKTSTATDKFTYTFDVYAVGFEYNGIRNVAKLWKNGVATSLSDGTKNAEAKGICVKNNDVYVVGYENNGTVDIAKLWVNGLTISLSNLASHAVGITYGSYLYIYGDEVNQNNPQLGRNSIIWGGDGSIGWKGNIPNSTCIFVDDPSSFAQNFGPSQNMAGISSFNNYNEFSNVHLFNGFKKGSDVYYVGYSGPVGGKLIKNGVDISFTTPNNAQFFDGSADDTDINIVGSVNDFPKLWLNGQMINLNGDSATGYARAVDMYAKNVIIGGMNDGKATLWFNRRAFNLTDGTHIAYVHDVFIKPTN